MSPPPPQRENHELVYEDCRMTINDIADAVALSYVNVQAILTSELNVQRVSANFVHRLLSTESK